MAQYRTAPMGAPADPARGSGDLVVVVPGIGGSVLETAGGEPLWGSRLGMLAKAALRPQRFVERLALATDPGDGPAGDGVVPVGVLDVPGIVPFFANLDGYRDLVDHLTTLQRPLRLAPLVFAYDWRLSTAYNADRLRAAVDAALDVRRQHHPASRTFIVAHSMGGLVARYYLEALGGAERCRTLVTLGTPYRGAVKAVGVLTGGLGPGGLAAATRDVARTWPGARHLLPTGAVVREGDGFVAASDAVTIAGIPPAWFADARRIHDGASPHDRGTPTPYRCVALVGTFQPTRAVRRAHRRRDRHPPHARHPAHAGRRHRVPRLGATAGVDRPARHRRGPVPRQVAVGPGRPPAARPACWPPATPRS